MAENKTKTTDADVEEFILKVDNDIRREDSFRLVEIFRSISGFEPKMYGPTIIGFGNYHYKYDSGHEGDAPIAAFSPRKDSLVFYFDNFKEREGLLDRLGKHRSGKACVYVKKLADIDLSVLEEITRKSIKQTKSKYPDK
jgi:hypothetical protein